MNSKERVVVTGVGLATPIGNNPDEAWEQCLAGRSGIGPCTRFETSGHDCRSASLVPTYALQELRAPKNQKFMNPGARHLVHAAKQAVAGAGVRLENLEPSRVAVHVGSGRVGPEPSEFFRAFEVARTAQGGPDWDQLGGRASRLVDPYFPLRTLSNSAAALLAMEICARGPSSNFAQSDVASALALDAACRDLMEGRCDLAVAGGCDCLVTPACYLAFEKRGFLSAQPPEDALRPFDQEADGLVLGEGAAVLILERWNDARARTAPLLAEITAFAARSCGGQSMQLFASPDAASTAFREAASGDQPDFVVASGFGIPEADAREAVILSEAAGNRLPITAFKGLTGYLGAATAAVELTLGILALKHRFIPPVARHRQRQDGVMINVVTQPVPLSSAAPGSAVFLSHSWTGQSAAIHVRTVSS